MIGKGKSISHTRASMSYGWNQEKEAEIVLKEFLYGDSPAEITQEFKMLQNQNHHCTKNTLSFVISPTIEDGKTLNKDKLHAITKRFIHEMKLGERQAIAFVHQDKDHKHIHLYVNRIDFKGVAYNDSFIGKRSQLVAEKVAEHLRLTTVKQVHFEKAFNLLEIRTEIKRRHELTIKQFKPISFDDYIKSMQANDVKVIPTINNQNKLQGFRFEFDGHNLKGSEVHRNMSLGNIGKQISVIQGKSILMENKVSVTLAGKLVDLTPSLALKITKFILKKQFKKEWATKQNIMTKLEELTALLVNEIDDLKHSVDKLEQINTQLKEIKIRMDLGEYKSVIEYHQQQMKGHLSKLENFEIRFDSKIKGAKIYPTWAVVVFILLLGFVLALFVLIIFEKI